MHSDPNGQRVYERYVDADECALLHDDAESYSGSPISKRVTFGAAFDFVHGLIVADDLPIRYCAVCGIIPFAVPRQYWGSVTRNVSDWPHAQYYDPEQ